MKPEGHGGIGDEHSRLDDISMDPTDFGLTAMLLHQFHLTSLQLALDPVTVMTPRFEPERVRTSLNEK